MTIATIFAYLAGRRGAILEVARDRAALPVGALLVLSASLARNYDRASLIHEPWRLLGPFVASLAISVPLFLALYGFARWKGMEGPGIGRAYRSFLGLYWMTAPLAWLYGIPYERFLSTAGAVEANLWTLALVSAWRVALMIRASSVVFDLPVRVATSLVMLVADAAALTALRLVPLPVVSLMGGISPEQEGIALAGLLVGALGVLSLPLWILLVLWFASNSTERPEWEGPRDSGPGAGSVRALVFAGLVLIAWAAVLPATQPEQILAHRVRSTFRDDGPAAALALMSAREPSDFPPGWRPPPLRFPGEPTSDELLDTLEALAERPRPDWVTDRYTRMFLDRLDYDSYLWPQELLDQHAVRLAAILTRLARGPEMANKLLQHDSQGIEARLGGAGVPASQQDALRILHQLAYTEAGGPVRDPIPATLGDETATED